MSLTYHQARFRKFLIGLGGITLFTALVFLLASRVDESVFARDLVSSLGYFGVFISATIAGINLLFPAPATALTPIFLAAGLDFTYITIALICGTLLADAIGYLIGIFGKHVTEHVHPRFYDNIKTFDSKHHKMVLPTVFLFAAIVPLPNEIILIPLGLIGYKFRYLIIPLVLGTIIHQTAYAYGFSNLFNLFT